ncbi:hypothetical protein GR198_28500 [Rhizobium leguminosarum]|uniref:Fic family protein n=1 Tax=Rhizobium leguminosarum TaxID=384 RepID=UPI0013C1AA48|nr:hypothetical protein [Rhizobium leguminosarum]NEH59668.1 hypothetical protein [Rhizobium leguminosarum]
MKQVMAQYGLAAPTFESDRNVDEFTASFLFHHFLDEKDIAWLGNFKGLELSQDQVKGLIFVREVGAISNSIYRSLNSVDTLVASRNLRKLRSMELLIEQGSGARTTYVPGPEFIRLVTMDGSTKDRKATMDGKQEDIPQATDLKGLFLTMPDRLKKDVKTAQLSQRLKTEPTLELIIRLCKWKDLSLAEISELLGKSAPHVSTKYIQPLLAEGCVSYTIPEMIQHPHQKYRTMAGKT